MSSLVFFVTTDYAQYVKLVLVSVTKDASSY